MWTARYPCHRAAPGLGTEPAATAFCGDRSVVVGAHVNSKFVGAGVAVAIAAGLGFALLANGEEETEFDTVERAGPISVRDYPALTVAETIQQGLRETALSRGFMALSDYIFGKDRAGARIPMTAPVLADGDDDGRGWRTRFVIPARFDVETLPVPGDGVTLRPLPARRLAALRFSGEAGDAELAAREDELRAWVASRGYRTAGPIEHAYYSSPFMPGPLRRNEVLLPIAA